MTMTNFRVGAEHSGPNGGSAWMVRAALHLRGRWAVVEAGTYLHFKIVLLEQPASAPEPPGIAWIGPSRGEEPYWVMGYGEFSPALLVPSTSDEVAQVDVEAVPGWDWCLAAAIEVYYPWDWVSTTPQTDFFRFKAEVWSSKSAPDPLYSNLIIQVPDAFLYTIPGEGIGLPEPPITQIGASYDIPWLCPGMPGVTLPMSSRLVRKTNWTLPGE